MFITSASIPSAFKVSAASNALATIIPVAIIDTSLPSLTTSPFPNSNFYDSSCITGVAALPNLKYIGPTYSAAAKTICLASTASAGFNTTMFGKLLISEISSIAWWRPPSSPTVTPAWVAAILTFIFG